MQTAEFVDLCWIHSRRLCKNKYISYIYQWRSQGFDHSYIIRLLYNYGFDPGGHDNFFGGAIFILDSGAEPAKWATDRACSPSIGRMKWAGKTLLDII